MTQSTPITSSRSYERRSSRTRFPRSWWMLMAFMLFSVLVMYVHTVIQEANLNRMKKDIDALREVTLKDRMRLEMARNPQVIDKKAILIGMKQPQEVVYFKKPLNLLSSRAGAIPPRRPVVQEGY
ncbi:MAG: hypothetical protein VKN33_02720 [Candidatus Sericytochromatia bacterium]|nr:hypothetical protein [Candidatus Sericytochromatia bacterium]